ncbi:MAG: hypothetical protein EA376_02220 [Phycisphaeraceae bacterium]|nr:MAG: hypothetical protein EA376_02220 [Phycisphaeraceae bacterium]
MRWVVNALVGFILITTMLGVGMHLRAQREEEMAIVQVRSAVGSISREIRVRAGMGDTELNGRGWPVTVKPSWFSGGAPLNRLLDPERPWLEVAPPEHADLQHPPQRVAIHRDIASFWYNPGNGVVRARAPMSVTDRRTTEVYNRINSASLSSIFADLPAISGHRPPEEEAPDNDADDADELSEWNMDPTRPRDRDRL